MFNSLSSKYLYHLNNTVRLRNLRSVDSVRKIHSGVCLSYPRQISKSNNINSPATAGKYDRKITEKSSYMDTNQENLYSYPADEKNKYSLLSDEYDGINLQSKSFLPYQQSHFNICFTKKLTWNFIFFYRRCEWGIRHRRLSRIAPQREFQRHICSLCN